MPPLSRKAVLPLIRAALWEDRAASDITSRAVIPSGTRIRARIIAKAPGVAAGVETAALTFTTLDPSIRCRLHKHSGAALSPGAAILTVEGRARSIFAAERTALNLLGHLCGIATLTRRYVRRVRGTHAVILDTRKTLPGLRALEKYAVRVGGGRNHRADLAEAMLIKTNHLLARSSKLIADRNTIASAVTLARRKAGTRFVEIEVTNFAQFRAAVDATPDAILLDNWSLPAIRKAVSCLSAVSDPRRARPLLEVSGGVTLANVRAIARMGVDRISVGRLTHSAPSLDVSLQVVS